MRIHEPETLTIAIAHAGLRQPVFQACSHHTGIILLIKCKTAEGVQVILYSLYAKSMFRKTYLTKQM